jgi:hypothetical protein
MYAPEARAAANSWHEAADGRIRWLDGFLAPRSCQRILAQLRQAHWQQSRVRRRVGEAGYAPAVSRRRVSTGAREISFPRDLIKTVRALDRRLERFLPRFIRRRERWVATRYAVGDRFDDHLDAGVFGHEPQGERSYTVMLCLQSPRCGGATRFRHLDLELTPVAGRLVIWKNVTAKFEADAQMRHASLPVTAGRKTVLVTHVRQRQAPRRMRRRLSTR